MVEGQVVHQRVSRPDIEQRAVAFVQLSHHVLSLATTGIYAQVGAEPADVERGVEARTFQDPGEHRTDGTLAVGAGDTNRGVGLGQQRQKLGAVQQGLAGIPGVGHLRIGVRYCGRVNYNSGFVNVRGRMADLNVDSLFSQRMGNRGFTNIAAADLHPVGQQQPCTCTHPDAADSQQVHVLPRQFVQPHLLFPLFHGPPRVGAGVRYRESARGCQLLHYAL